MAVSWILICTLLISFIHVACCHYRTHKNTTSYSDARRAHDGADELIFVHIISRHGMRNILAPYPQDPYKDEELWQFGFGELSNVGKRQHYELGDFIGERYANLIGSEGYSPKKIYIQSTDVDRTIMSAQTCLAGMFPPTNHEIWHHNMKCYNPVPVHTIPASDDYLLASSKQCDRFDYLMSLHLNQTNYKGLFKKHRALIKYLETHSGTKLNSLKKLLLLHDTLSVEQYTDKRLPDWAERVMKPNGDFKMLARFFYQVFTSTNEMKKLTSGFLLKEIFDRCSKKAESTLSPDRSIWMYFGHDVTMINFLNSFGFYEPNMSPYASCIFVELYKSDNGPYIKIFYRASAEPELLFLEIPNCGPKCLLKDLYKLYWDILPANSFDAECALRYGEYLPKNANPESYAVLMKD